MLRSIARNTTNKTNPFNGRVSNGREAFLCDLLVAPKGYTVPRLALLLESFPVKMPSDKFPVKRPSEAGKVPVDPRMFISRIYKERPYIGSLLYTGTAI